MPSIKMKEVMIKDVPVIRCNYDGPIMEVNFLRESEWEGCAITPYELRIAKFSNFTNDFMGDNDVEAFIEEKLVDFPATKKVVITYHKP